MILSFGDGTSSGWTVKDQDGYYLNDDQTQGVYHARTVDLTSRPSREAANRLYQRLGFRPRQTNIYRFET